MVGTVLAPMIADIKPISQVFRGFKNTDMLEIAQHLALLYIYCFNFVSVLTLFQARLAESIDEQIPFVPILDTRISLRYSNGILGIYPKEFFCCLPGLFLTA